jgi:hypothetical protein
MSLPMHQLPQNVKQIVEVAGAVLAWRGIENISEGFLPSDPSEGLITELLYAKTLRRPCSRELSSWPLHAIVVVVGGGCKSTAVFIFARTPAAGHANHSFQCQSCQNRSTLLRLPRWLVAASR